MFFIAPGPLTFDLFERGFDARMALWLGAVLVGTGIAGLRGALPGVEPRPYIIRFTEDRPNPLYRRVCYTFAWSEVITFAVLNIAGLVVAIVTGAVVPEADLPLRVLSARRARSGCSARSGRLPRVKASTKGEGHERRYFYGSVWAVCWAQPALWLMWKVVPRTRAGDTLKLARLPRRSSRSSATWPASAVCRAPGRSSRASSPSRTRLSRTSAGSLVSAECMDRTKRSTGPGDRRGSRPSGRHIRSRRARTPALRCRCRSPASLFVYIVILAGPLAGLVAVAIASARRRLDRRGVDGRRARLRPRQSLRHRAVRITSATSRRSGGRCSASTAVLLVVTKRMELSRASGSRAAASQRLRHVRGRIIMKVFVAGGSGAIGVPLVRALVAAGHHVTALTRSPAKQSMLRALGATPAVADALDADALRRVVVSARPTHVIHQLTALPKAGRRSARDLEPTNRLADRRHAEPDRRGRRRRRAAHRRRIVRAAAARRTGMPAEVQAGADARAVDGIADSRSEPRG